MAKRSKYALAGCASAAAMAASVLSVPVALAAPSGTPFLSVDFNGSAGGAPTGPTQAGFSGFGVSNPAGVTAVTQTVGGYPVTIALNPAATGSTLTSRDRGAQGSSPTYSDLLRDFALVIRDTNHGLGYSYLAVSIGGLTPNTAYEYTAISVDPNSVNGVNREGYSTAVPAEYAPGAAPATGGPYYYTPAFTAPNGEYDDSVTFDVTSDGTGTATVYAFGDTNSYSNQTATIVSAFQLAAVPEPAATGVTVAAVAMAAARRRRRTV